MNPIPHELNELDWKTDVSSKGSPNLAKHISAFANDTNGGYLVFGIDDQGRINGLVQKKIKDIISKISSIARDGVEPKISIDHAVTIYKEKTLLFICIRESKEKPVHLRGKGFEESYIRSGASTHKMSKQEIGWCLLRSKVPSFEEQDADAPALSSDVLSKLDVTAFFNLLKIPVLGNVDTVIQKLEEYCLIKPENQQYVINNLGVLLAAQNMSHFFGHERRGIRVICYKSSSKIEATKDKTFDRGYAIGFNEILDYIQE
ncbi:MAG: hypothetical protein CMF49_08540 [Legionellales bacterium]|nr:hypothetical protein [Legionellales bacterium]